MLTLLMYPEMLEKLRSRDTHAAPLLGLSLGLAILVLAAALLTSWLLSQLLSRPLRDLSAAMEDFERDAGGFTYRPPGGTREVPGPGTPMPPLPPAGVRAPS